MFAFTLSTTVSQELEHAHPTKPYNEILADSFTQLASELGVTPAAGAAAAFGQSPGGPTWRAFPDTVAGLQQLAKHYKLIILSNVDRANIEGTLTRPTQLGDVPFAAAYTAQDAGAYKPDRRAFAYLFEHARADLSVDKEKGELLHVAVSLRADLVPAAGLGLRSAWIARGGDRKGHRGISAGDYDVLRSQAAFEWQFDTIGEFADEVERQFAAKEKK